MGIASKTAACLAVVLAALGVHALRSADERADRAHLDRRDTAQEEAGAPEVGAPELALPPGSPEGSASSAPPRSVPPSWRCPRASPGPASPWHAGRRSA